MNVTIHRGTKQIGGSCVEVRAGSDRILLDLGLPLKRPGEVDAAAVQPSVQELLVSGVLPHVDGVYAGYKPEVRAVIMSHVHQDHMGLAHFVHPDIPVWATEGTWALTDALSPFIPMRGSIANRRSLPMNEPQRFGSLEVTAVPVDHSAPAAAALLVEGDGKRLLYTGDLRAHGRKGCLFNILKRTYAGIIDTLLIEGTTIGRSGQEPSSEQALEYEFMWLLRQQPHLTLVFCSGQNLDRIVTLYRAAKRTQKTMIIDLYTAFTLHKFTCISTNLPQWDWPEIRVVPWGYQQRRLTDAGHTEFVEATKPKWIGKKEMIARGRELILLMRSNRKMTDIEDELGDKSRQVQVVWSQWDGYWADDKHVRPFCEKHGINHAYIHTSGHASWRDLKHLINVIRPTTIVPIHTEHASFFAQHFGNVLLPSDGVSFSVY